ncbi:MAG TPA: hypothetical protein VK279_09615 [Solirubrobacteraceae bacterium]|nr:hypothetical protein [Solirubrobacteraceae bacterium]
MGAPSRVAPITIISPVRRAWAWWLRLTWPLARRNPAIVRPLVRLGFINFAHWSLVDRIPASARRREGVRLPHPYVLFQSNFNGPADLYIDAFSQVVRGRIWLLWGGAYRYPGARPMERFKRFIFARAIPTDHYWCAYPQSSSRRIVSTLALTREVDAFGRRAAELPPAEFAAACDRFLADVAGHL